MTVAFTRTIKLHWIFVFATFALLIAASPVSAQTVAPKSDPGSLLDAIVGIEAQVPSLARTADTLGQRRQGSGAVISQDGLILTIGYLILEASSVDIIMQDGRRLPAEVLSYDHDSGFGLVRAQGRLGVEPLELGTSDKLVTNDQALIATRDGISEALGVKVVSRREFAGSWEYLLDDAIFTAPPHRSFGGAALIGPEGTLLGIGSLFVGNSAETPLPVPGNMFVPIELLKPILADLIATGRRQGPSRPWLGIYPQTLQGHVFLTRIAIDGPAAAAGLQEGDLIVAVNGVGVGKIGDLYRAIWATGNAGTAVVVTVLSRGGNLRDVSISSIDRRAWLRLEPSL